MGKLLKVLGAILLLGILGIGGLVGYLYYEQSEHAATAVPYIQEKFPRLASWDPDVVSSLMTPQAHEAQSEEELLKILTWFGKLGAYRSMGEPEFVNIYSGVDPDLGRHSLLTYSFDAAFEAGEAEVTVTLLALPDGYQIHAFNVTSSALIDGA